MTLSNFVAYVTQKWKNKPDTSTPLSAERLTHQEDGIKANSDAIQELAAAVVSQIVNNPDKIASMAALYAVDQKVAGLDGKIGDTSKLPAGTTDAVGAIAQLYSNLAPSGITYVSHAINMAYGSGNISYHVVGKVCFVYFVFTPSQKCDNVGLLNNGVLPLAKDSLYHSVSTWGNPNVAVSLVQVITTGGLRFWCGESSIGMQIFDSFSYCIK
ncbi:hypothetical protein DWY84_03995 [Clostridium sp. AF27-2AA]|jgi:hypothetical protein|uniref:hypothetical protein n=1 Tax=Clostridium sp. AF27-2AA TaxID=2292206 RepID=UPI000E52F590|nr:hypothetical protein [Clostridium sp. AF27-2AA]RHQ34245.1 hypothetical protein DWY84_03995 [Clostridium sp. AF27-2AA]